MGAGMARKHLHTHICLQLTRLKGNFKFIKNFCKTRKSFGGDFSSLVDRAWSPLRTVQETVGFNFSMEI